MIMSPLNGVWKLSQHCKIQAVRQGGKESDIHEDGVRSKRRREPYASNIVKYNVLTFYHPPRTGKWLSVSLLFSFISLSPSYEWREKERLCTWMTAAIGKAPALICLFWPMLDLRGLISLDNKTKRVNVLMVADGTGILGKCVKLVLTSGPHSSPPRCDLSLPSLRCSLHPQSFYPSLFPRVALHSSCDLVPRSPLLPYNRTQGERDVGLNGKTRGKGRATGALQASPHAGGYPSKPKDPLSDCSQPISQDLLLLYFV